MLEQIGPHKLLEQLKAEAPNYAKLIPELPRLLGEFLQQRKSNDAQAQTLQALLQAQQRTNKLLQGVIYGALGFAFGLFVMQWVIKVRLF